MATLWIGNNRTEEMVGDLSGMSSVELAFAGCGAQRMLWFAEDGDVLVLPWEPEPHYLAYVTGLTGTQAPALTVVVPPPGVQGTEVLTPDRLADPGFRAALARVLAARAAAGDPVDRVVGIAGNATVAALAEALGIGGAVPGHAFAAQGGLALVNSKAAFRALAAGAGVAVAPGTVAGSPAEAEAAAEALLAAGHSVMVKVEYQAGGHGNEVLVRDEAVPVPAGAQRAVPLADRAAVAAYLAERWGWLTGGRDHRVVVERYFTDAVALYAEFTVGDGGAVLSGCGEMLMDPVVVGEITPPVTPDAAVLAELVDQAGRLCESLRVLGYRGTVSADAFLTPKGELYFSETNGRLTGSTHLHEALMRRLVGAGRRADRVILELAGLAVPSFPEAVAAVRDAGLAFDPATATGVVFSCDFARADGSVMYCVIAGSAAEARTAEHRLRALFGG
ncbi:peptide ligase PGM1-related protein [Kitasatospora sp. NPDC096147]|uniref:preATP grasp domain-containing protein n=1 Tax=Kitasatospora sp. NPDC096147 TaxID=3364093 RepID=UPI0038241D8F